MMELRKIIIFRDFFASNQLSRIRTACSSVTILSFLGVFDVHQGCTENDGATALQKRKRRKRRNDADTEKQQKNVQIQKNPRNCTKTTREKCDQLTSQRFRRSLYLCVNNSIYLWPRQGFGLVTSGTATEHRSIQQPLGV